jgi:D-alanyl-D-alanine carboxypeptidase
VIEEKLESVLRKKAKTCKTLQFAMNVPQLHLKYAYSDTMPDQRFHSASVGKLFTATLLLLAIEQGRLTLDTNVAKILNHHILNDLFVHRGIDYREVITVQQLLAHTSGINDYFESKTMDGSRFTDDVLQNPDKFWTPIELIDYTRNRQKSVAAPGDTFFYSDTGYLLLGLIIEKIFDMPFHEALEVMIFRPCGMSDTHLCFYSPGFDQSALAPLFLNGIDIRLYKSLSCDFSGGGLSTTTSDVLKFLDHFQNERLINKHSISQMTQFEHRYLRGLHYGVGMMQIRFEQFFFLLRGLPRLQGHLGVSGVHAWYDPASKASYVLNVGNTKDMVKSFRLLIQIVQMVQRACSKKT